MGKRLTQEEAAERIKNSFLEPVELISKYINRREIVKLHCHNCGHDWEVVAGNVLYRDSRGLHRCPNCMSQKKGKYLKCAYCGKEIFRSEKDINKNKTGYFYCSRECGNRHKNQLRKNAGEWDFSANYRLKAMETYPHVCLCCGWNEDERILEVHHIDENRQNNLIENLCILCPTCHRKITLGYYKLDLNNKQLIKL